MKLLHTSDWHLGRSLYGKKRDEEHRKFLQWLLQTIKEQKIEVVVIAGDVFDTTTPSHQAQALYYDFLCQVTQTHCRHVVVVAGNHDSPSFINAPQALLAALNVYVIGQSSGCVEDEVLQLKNAQNEVALIVCAVPYLRDRDIREAQVNESVEEKAKSMLQGIQHHYERIAAYAEHLNQQLPSPVPVIATGHLFAAGGTLLADDGVRDLYVGSLAHVSASVFPTTFNYVALGHLHVPQKVAKLAHIRYCGSPIPIGFGEATQQKMVCIIEFEADHQPIITEWPIPCFQKLARIRGNWDEIEEGLCNLKNKKAKVWVEISYSGTELITDLRERIDAVVGQSEIEVLCVQNRSLVAKTLEQNQHQQSLTQLKVEDVFQQCLDAHDIPPEQQTELKYAFSEIVSSLPNRL